MTHNTEWVKIKKRVGELVNFTKVVGEIDTFHLRG